MKTKTRVLIVWTLICCGLAVIMSIGSLQSEAVAGSSYKLTLLPTSYLATTGVGTAKLDSCEFFEFETTSGGHDFGMLTRAPVSGCWDENQYATASIKLQMNDTISIKEGLVRVTLQAKDGVIWAEQRPTFGQVAFQIFISTFLALIVWAVIAAKLTDF